MAAIDHNSPFLQRKSNANSVALAMLRIAVGFFFAVFGQYKIFGPGLCTRAFATMSVDSFAMERTLSWFRFSNE